jgi:hypothetical protein
MRVRNRKLLDISIHTIEATLTLRTHRLSGASAAVPVLIAGAMMADAEIMEEAVLNAIRISICNAIKSSARRYSEVNIPDPDMPSLDEYDHENSEANVPDPDMPDLDEEDYEISGRDSLN